jgi:transketolase
MSGRPSPSDRASAALRSSATKPYGHAFQSYAKTREHVVCVTNDLTASCEADLFRDAYPERYFSLGMAEQNLIGVTAGLAREGLVPFYPTFSVFGTRRPYEQIALSVAYPALPVRIIGFLPGLTTPGGVTHQATDDIALMRTLPNMTVLEVGDATEAETVLDVIDALPGPVFCRMMRGQVPVLFEDPMRLNTARVLSRGSDLLLITSGVCTELGLSAVEVLNDAGVAVEHLHVSTLKPFTDPIVLESLAAAKRVITAENHLVHGGLGTAVAELLAEHPFQARLYRVGIDDTFTHGGTRDYLFDHYGIGTGGILAAAVRRRCCKPTSPKGSDMTAIVIGEALVDLIEDRGMGEPVYRPRWGGSPFNVAVGLARLGVAAEFIGPLAHDHFGSQLAAFALAEGVGTSHCPAAAGGTILAVASRAGERVTYDYYGTWEVLWSLGPIASGVLRGASVVHVGSTAFNAEPARSTVRRVLSEAGCLTTVDPNPRRMLIEDLDEYRAFLRGLLPSADIVKFSDDDAQLIAPELDPMDLAREIQRAGVPAVLLTSGSSGSVCVTDDGVLLEPAVAADVVDPTGAGDSFMATVIAEVGMTGLPTSHAAWRQVMRRANAAAAFTCARTGGAEAMPTSIELGATVAPAPHGSGAL